MEQLLRFLKVSQHALKPNCTISPPISSSACCVVAGEPSPGCCRETSARLPAMTREPAVWQERPERSIVVVGHSSFFKRLFEAHLGTVPCSLLCWFTWRSHQRTAQANVVHGKSCVRWYHLTYGRIRAGGRAGWDTRDGEPWLENAECRSTTVVFN